MEVGKQKKESSEIRHNVAYKIRSLQYWSASSREQPLYHCNHRTRESIIARYLFLVTMLTLNPKLQRNIWLTNRLTYQ
ncbi:hypothetical protein QE152_g3847 [Popillia japonica]|uniref:Uncharacterized protein n=1 Tax=Popillia japonica TaxID=7064 RepID=A0AAW1N342_POPJA